MRILVIEDQHDIAENIWDYLERRGHVVDHAADGQRGLRMAEGGGFDAIVLDLGLPRMDGLALCRRLREAGHGTPVLMLTARDTLDDKLRGFAEGADDYMVKPFALAELEVRLRTLHRRGRGLPGEPLKIGSLLLWPDRRRAERDGRTLILGPIQTRLLETLMRAAPAVVTHEALIAAAWGGNGADPAALHSQIHALRAAVDRPFAEPLIHSLHGIGYRMAADA
ncbi:MAG TPA: response regulator transcription factor [Xanthomonadaceae bacterium]|nr:response regulator transcription factor [Xanthomonadaceae bacterium]